MNDLEALRDRLRTFAQERDWDQFHSPKNLSMALMAEVGELMEHFMWLTEEQSYNLPPDKQGEVEQELAYTVATGRTLFARTIRAEAGLTRA